MEHLLILGFVFLNLFMIVSAVDLFYFHIWKYKLHTRPESRYEHKLHMAFAFLMVPLAYFLYYQDFGGYGLWAAVFFVVAALSTEMLDVLSEGDSRASIGGLTTGEYSLHVAATILKVASFAFMFAAKPVAAWSLDSPISLGSYGTIAEATVIQIMVGSFIVGLLHLALMSKRLANTGCATVCSILRCTRFRCCQN